MNKVVEFSIDGIDFVAERLKPFEQFNLILKIISIVAKGSDTHSSSVEQMLHNLVPTGKNIDVKENIKGIEPVKLLIDAVKGALAKLSDTDRDWLINELIKGVKIKKNHAGVFIQLDATRDELNAHFTSFQSIFKLLTELVKINLGFL